MSNPKITPERYAPHLSEFYPIMDSSAPRLPRDQMRSPQDNTPSHSSLLSHSRAGSRRPSSSAASNTGSMMSDLQTLITRRDVMATHEAMSSLSAAAADFSASLAAVSRSSSRMAAELEQFARLKGCGDDTAEKFMNASGLFHLLGNHELIMGDFTADSLDHGVAELNGSFQEEARALENMFNRKRKEESLKLKIQEKFNNDFSRRSVRNLVSYRESLHSLQQQLDQLELLKYDYYSDSYALVEGTCRKVLGRVASVTRAQVEISENIARKGWSGGGLDDLLIDAEDPFAMNEGDEPEGEPELPSPVNAAMPSTTNRAIPSSLNNAPPSTIPEAVPGTSPMQSAEPRMVGGTMTPPVGGLSAAVALSKLALVHKESESDGESKGESESDCDNDNSFALPMSSSAGDRGSAEGTPRPTSASDRGSAEGTPQPRSAEGTPQPRSAEGTPQPRSAEGTPQASIHS